MTENLKRIMLSLTVMSVLSGCYNMDSLSVRPSKTTVTYGTSSSTAEKDAKNNVLTDTKKDSWTIKQEFRWDNIKRKNR